MKGTFLNIFVFIIMWVSGCAVCLRILGPDAATSTAIFVGGINYVVADTVANLVAVITSKREGK